MSERKNVIARQVRSYALALLLLGGGLVSGCSEPQLQPLDKGDVILAFGDSLTAGVGVSRADSYPSQLERMLKIPVVNAGVSGETTAEGLERFAQVLDTHQPSLVLLLEGGNDILRNLSQAEAASNLAQMIEISERRGIALILIGVPAKRLFSSHAAFYPQLAEQYALVYDGEIIGELMRSPNLKSDAVHFNRQGYARLASRIAGILSERGALE